MHLGTWEFFSSQIGMVLSAVKMPDAAGSLSISISSEVATVPLCSDATCSLLLVPECYPIRVCCRPLVLFFHVFSLTPCWTRICMMSTTRQTLSVVQQRDKKESCCFSRIRLRFAGFPSRLHKAHPSSIFPPSIRRLFIIKHSCPFYLKLTQTPIPQVHASCALPSRSVPFPSLLRNESTRKPILHTRSHPFRSLRIGLPLLHRTNSTACTRKSRPFYLWGSTCQSIRLHLCRLKPGCRACFVLSND